MKLYAIKFANGTYLTNDPKIHCDYITDSLDKAMIFYDIDCKNFDLEVDSYWKFFTPESCADIIEKNGGSYAPVEVALVEIG